MPILPFLALAFGAFLMFGPYLIVDKGMGFWQASGASMQAVKQDFWPLLGYYVVASLIGSVGSVVCLVGFIVTWPITWCMLAIAYRELFPAGAEAAPGPEPVSAPPAPAPATPPPSEPQPPGATSPAPEEAPPRETP